MLQSPRDPPVDAQRGEATVAVYRFKMPAGKPDLRLQVAPGICEREGDHEFLQDHLYG